MREEPTLFFDPCHRPKVLLLGNGLNRVYGGASWAGLLEKINRTGYTPSEVGSIPLPLQAVLLSNDHVNSSLQQVADELSQCDLHPWQAKQLQALLALPFDCILTPNFTYEVECAADPDFARVKLRHRKYQRHTPAVTQAERQFMLHTYYALPTPNGEVPLFHIHGEARKTRSMILGHYYYGNLLLRYDRYLARRAPGCRYRIGNDPRGVPIYSWLDYFILGDVYSLGFGFDTAEMDLWWLLCRKKRECAAHGELYFIEPTRSIYETKFALLRAYNARHITLGYSEPSGAGYRAFYEKAIASMGNIMEGIPLATGRGYEYDA